MIEYYIKLMYMGVITYPRHNLNAGLGNICQSGLGNTRQSDSYMVSNPSFGYTVFSFIWNNDK